VATQPSGAKPAIRRCADGEAELALLVATIRRLIRDGVPPAEIAILVRINAQVPPLEAALTKAGIAFRVRGQRFFERPEVREALRLMRRLPAGTRGPAVADALEARLRADLGFDPDGDAAGAETRERTASLALVLAIAREATAGRAGVETAPELDARALLADFEARAAAEAAGSADGVNLLTLHRAKGLEWDAVLLPGMEEGTLPIRQAADDEALAEERRLLYVGLTRARRHLALSWAERRAGPGDRESQRRPSRFLPALEAGHPGTGARPGALPRPGPTPGPPGVGKPRVTVLPGPVAAPMTKGRPTDEPLMADLRAWRSTRARDDFVPAYVVAHDALLAAIVEQRPGSIAALRRVKGMGPAKLDRYGDEILAILARH
jgi:DNA helicase-2/ATP-dependent DNA helicase PcrA